MSIVNILASLQRRIIRNTPYRSSGNLVLRYDTELTGESMVDFYLYDDYSFGGLTGSLTFEVSDGRSFTMVPGDYLEISELSGQGTITISGSLSDYLGNEYYDLPGVLETYWMAPIVEVVDYGEIPGLRGIQLRYASMLTKVPPAISPHFRDLSYHFIGCSTFNHPNISQWDTSNIILMQNTFEECNMFDQPIGTWNTSNVINVSDMFRSALSFNQNINNWVTTKFTTINGMFRDAAEFNQPLNLWNTSNVTDMRNAFYNSANFNQDINSWDTSKVTMMGSMFEGASRFNSPLNQWNISSVVYTMFMFRGCTDFNQDLDMWDMSNVIDMESMFRDATSFNGNVSTWNVSKVFNFLFVFAGATSFNSDISNWDVSAATRMNNMFDGAASFNQDIGGWNVLNVVTLTTPNGTYGMPRMFRNASSFNQDLTCWPVQNYSVPPTEFSTGSALTAPNIPRWGQANNDPTGRTGASCNIQIE